MSRKPTSAKRLGNLRSVHVKTLCFRWMSEFKPGLLTAFRKQAAEKYRPVRATQG